MKHGENVLSFLRNSQTVSGAALLCIPQGVCTAPLHLWTTGFMFIFTIDLLPLFRISELFAYVAYKYFPPLSGLSFHASLVCPCRDCKLPV